MAAGCEQHGIGYHTFRESLSRENILLSRKTLADLACWEPHTFKALTSVAKQNAFENNLDLFSEHKPPKIVMNEEKKK